VKKPVSKPASLLFGSLIQLASDRSRTMDKIIRAIPDRAMQKYALVRGTPVAPGASIRIVVILGAADLQCNPPRPLREIMPFPRWQKGGNRDD
jgi:hypothetical protein